MSNYGDWIQSDDMQWVRRISFNKYELIEANYCDNKYLVSEAEIVDISEYINSDGSYTSDAKSIIKAYYKDLNDFESSWLDLDTRYQVLAEMIYESTSHFLNDYSLVSEHDAERILKYYTETGKYLDLEDEV